MERLQKRRDKAGNKVRWKSDGEREMMDGARKDVYEERLNDGGE